MKRPRRVLVVDDQESWREILSESLLEQGFHVDAVDSTVDALKRLDETFYHVLVLDIRMKEGEKNNVDGMTLLSELDRRGISASSRIIMLSAYGTLEQMREAFTKFKVSDFASKRKFLNQDFLQQVIRIFIDMKINLDIVTHWEQISGPKPLVVDLQIGGARIKRDANMQALIADELDDLLCRLFYQAESLLLRPLSLGLSGMGVLWVQPFYDSGGGRPVVVKFGDFRNIESEYCNFNKYVQPFVSGGRSTSILNDGLRRTTHLGGIIYTLLGAASEKLENFGSFYRRSDVAQIKDMLDKLFRDTCAGWYANPGHLQPIDLTAEYQQTLGLTPEKLERALADNAKTVQGTHTLHFNSLDSERGFTNPVLALADRHHVKSTYKCTTHGDFNENNILVDNTGQSWLIDFGRTGVGHILRDVAELDSVVRFRLLAADDATLDERLKMEEALCRINRFSEVEELLRSFSTENTALAKAYAISQHLRTIARGLISQQPSDDISEYYVASLYYALNTIRVYSLPAIQRHHSLLSASLLTDGLTRSAETL